MHEFLRKPHPLFIKSPRGSGPILALTVGTFELTTLKPGDGVVAGPHRISINEFDKPLAKDRALRKFASPNTLRLTAEVSPEKTEFTFELK